jgi:uncharacterized protein YqeY
MDLSERIKADLKAAMIAKDSAKLSVIRFLQSAIKYREIELRPNPISNDEIMGVLKKLVKQRKESIDQFKAGGRNDLVDQETAELKILETYLPAQMSREQVETLVTDVIAALGAKTLKDMGSVIKEVIARSAGSADNKTVSELVKAKLSS